jgi:hypothetical protein
LSATLAFSLLAWLFRWSQETFHILQTNRARNAIFVPVMFWLVILAYVIMPHVALTPAQKSIASLWGLAPFGIIIGWGWGFATARKNSTPSVV